MFFGEKQRILHGGEKRERVRYQRVLDPSLPRTSNRGLSLPVCGSTFKHNSIQIGGGLKKWILVYFSIQKQKKYQSVKIKEIYGNTGLSSSKEL